MSSKDANVNLESVVAHRPSIPISSSQKARKERRDEKLQALRLKQNAQLIQAIWRGKLARNKVNHLLRSTSSGRSKVLEDDFGGDDESQSDEDEGRALLEAITVEQEVISVAERKSQDKKAEWPPPLSHSFSTDSGWPDLNLEGNETTDDKRKSVEHWIFNQKNIKIRTVTWNLCARKPPSVEETRHNLFPKNK